MMIRYLQVKDHKGIEKLVFKDLSNINILCGKNNSGKTATFEAICNEKKRGIGKMIESSEWLAELFALEAKRYSSPSPMISNRWFLKHLEAVIVAKEVWFSDEIELIKEDIFTSLERIPGLARRNDRTLFNVNKILTTFFRKSIDWFQPILIPPKRKLDSKIEIDFNESVQPNGKGILNRLFYLKNQDLRSKEYKTYLTIDAQFNAITDRNFNIIPDTDNNITLFFQERDQWIAADDSGLGLSDVLIIVTLLNDSSNTCICLEEPENHLHASYQK